MIKPSLISPLLQRLVGKVCEMPTGSENVPNYILVEHPTKGATEDNLKLVGLEQVTMPKQQHHMYWSDGAIGVVS